MSQRLVRRAAAGGLVAAALAAVAVAVPAHATLPGSPGLFTYGNSGIVNYRDPAGGGGYLIGADGGSWSPDGSLYAYWRPNIGIWTIDANIIGGGQVTSGAHDRTPAWSADGRKIFFSRDGELWFNSSGGGSWAGKLGENPDPTRWSDTRPSVSSHNDILFQRDDLSAGGSSVWLLPNGGAPQQLVANAAEPDFSPDGTQMAYRSTTDNQIYVANSNGTGATKITNSPSGTQDPQWSPDGQMLLFIDSSATTGGAVKAIHPDGTSEVDFGISQAQHAEWQPVNKNSVDRVWGQNAIGTGIAASQWNYADFGASDPVRVPAKAVVLSRSDAFYDALAGSALAINKQAPLLITPPDSLDSGVEGEIKRVLGTSGDVYLLGGTAALSSDIENRLTTLGYTTHRLAGANVFETAIAIDNEIMRGATPSIAVVATGMDYYDALAAGAAAGANPGTVVLLTNGSSMPWETANYLNTLAPADANGQNGTVLVAAGGPGDDALASGYDAGMMPNWGDNGFYDWPLVGSNALDTALDIAQFFFAAPPMAAVATYTGWYDALTGGAMSGLNDGPLLLTPPDGLYEPLKNYLWHNAGGMWDTVIMGGTAALPSSLQAPLGEAISAPGQWMYNDYPAIVPSSPMTPHASTLRTYGPKLTDVQHVVPGLLTTRPSKHTR